MSKSVNAAITSHNAILAARRAEIARNEELGKAATAFRRTGAQKNSGRGRVLAVICAAAVAGRKTISVADICERTNLANMRVSKIPLTKANLPAFVHRSSAWICERSMQAIGERYVFAYSPEKRAFAIGVYSGKKQHDALPYEQVQELARALPKAGSKPSVPLLPGPDTGSEDEGEGETENVA